MSCLVGLAEWRLPVNGVDALRLASSVGADGVQLDLGGPGRGPWVDRPGRVEELRAAAHELGVRLLAVAGNLFNDVGLTSDPDVVRPLLRRLVDAALALGVPLAFVPSFRRSTIDGPDAFAATVSALREAAVAAQERGLVFASENVLDSEQARLLADEIDSPAFRLVLDTFNPVTAGLPVTDLVGSLADLLADQVHVKDGPPDWGPSPMLGDGDGRLNDTVVALRMRSVPVHALVLENDYRDGNLARLTADLAWARRHARQFNLHTYRE